MWPKGDSATSAASLPGSRRLTEMALAVAMALILAQLPLYRLPQGGSITLVMVPLLGLALLRGTRAGVMAGMVFGLLHGLLQSPFFYHPFQILLDYPIAYGALGLAGLPLDLGYSGTPAAVVGFLLGWTGRLAAHLLSGWWYFSASAPDPAKLQASGFGPAMYVLSYNLSYLVPAGIITALVLFPVLKRLKRVGGIP